PGSTSTPPGPPSSSPTLPSPSPCYLTTSWSSTTSSTTSGWGTSTPTAWGVEDRRTATRGEGGTTEIIGPLCALCGSSSSLLSGCRRARGPPPVSLLLEP